MPANADGLIRAYQRQGLEPPEALQRPPVLPGGQELLEAFIEMSFARPVAQSPARIPFTVVCQWCHMRGVDDPEEVSNVLHYIRAVDEAWLEAVAANGDKPREAVDEDGGTAISRLDQMFGR